MEKSHPPVQAFNSHPIGYDLNLWDPLDLKAHPLGWLAGLRRLISSLGNIRVHTIAVLFFDKRPAQTVSIPNNTMTAINTQRHTL